MQNSENWSWSSITNKSIKIIWIKSHLSSSSLGIMTAIHKITSSVENNTAPTDPDTLAMQKIIDMVDKLNISDLDKFMAKNELRKSLIFLKKQDGVNPKVSYLTVMPRISVNWRGITEPLYSKKTITKIGNPTINFYGFTLYVPSENDIFVHLERDSE